MKPLVQDLRNCPNSPLPCPAMRTGSWPAGGGGGSQHGAARLQLAVLATVDLGRRLEAQQQAAAAAVSGLT